MAQYRVSFGEVTWNDFENIVEAHNPEEASPRTMPKPDLTYAFPVRDLSSSSSRGFARDEHLQAFSLQVLGNLVDQGISCAPTTGLRKWNKLPEKTGLSSTDRVCFPWAVVEMKRHATTDEGVITRCYCQAANAAAVALDMQAQLFKKLGHDSLTLMPPIITFTCVGPIVKVWLAYREQTGIFGGSTKVRVSCLLLIRADCL